MHSTFIPVTFLIAFVFMVPVLSAPTPASGFVNLAGKLRRQGNETTWNVTETLPQDENNQVINASTLPPCNGTGPTGSHVPALHAVPMWLQAGANGINTVVQKKRGEEPKGNLSVQDSVNVLFGIFDAVNNFQQNSRKLIKGNNTL